MELLRRRGLPVVRRSERPGAVVSGAVIVVDTVGELASIYSVGDVVFVGGSLVPHGGHNLLEPAMRGKPVLFGPHTENFRESAAVLTASGGGIVVRDRVELDAALARLFAEPRARAAVGAKALEAVRPRPGAVRDTLELIHRFLMNHSTP